MVSDKVMSFAEKSLRDFRNKLMNEPPPKTVNLLINSTIPPKGTKRGKSSADMDQSGSVCDVNNEEVDAELLLKLLDGDIPIERVG